MAPIKFLSAMIEGREIDVFGHGKMRRDFTYVDDLVAAITALMEHKPELGRPVGEHDSLSAVAPFRVVNIGGGAPTELMDFIVALEKSAGVTAKLNMLPMQPGDVVATEADTTLLRTLIGNVPNTPLADGLDAFTTWYKNYYRVN